MSTIKLKEELVKNANQIREKSRALKRGKIFEETMREDIFKPITKPLQQLVDKEEKKFNILDKTKLSLQALPALTSPRPRLLSQPLSTPTRNIPLLAHTPSKTFSPQGIQYTPPPRISTTIGPLASSYLANYLTSGNITDTTYGLNVDSDNSNDWKFKIGSENVKIQNDDVVVGDERYKGTAGLWELITLKEPKKYDSDDLENYKTILTHTNAHRKNYNPEEQLKGSKSVKYKTIIAPLFMKTGSGLDVKEVSSNKIDYIRWNDPNELVNKLRILWLSKEAGNTGVHNEIHSIIEELFEEKIIY